MAELTTYIIDTQDASRNDEMLALLKSLRDGPFPYILQSTPPAPNPPVISNHEDYMDEMYFSGWGEDDEYQAWKAAHYPDYDEAPDDVY